MISWVDHGAIWLIFDNHSYRGTQVLPHLRLSIFQVIVFYDSLETLFRLASRVVIRGLVISFLTGITPSCLLCREAQAYAIRTLSIELLDTNTNSTAEEGISVVLLVA